MATNDPTPRSFGQRLQSLSRQTVYLILIIVVSASVLISKFMGLTLPNKPGAGSQDFFAAIMAIPEGSTVFIQSDVTNSTRGESAGQFEALLRILMRRNIKFAVFCASGEPQAPQVAIDVIARINAQRIANGERAYERWNDWVSLGLFPDGRATAKAMMANLRTAIDKKDTPPGKPPTDVWQSPVMEKLKVIDDIGLYILVTASKTSDILVERLKFAPVTYGDVPLRTKLGCMVTGVMGPETNNYYRSSQIFGVVIGLNGAVEIEHLMENGIKPGQSETYRSLSIEGFKGMQNYARGMAYYLALHTAMGLLIVLVIMGNVGMWLTRRQTGGGA
ncbi:MAG TPA: hypothetical protein PLL78_04285 [Fimbriimonadaceae bacterium]|nr:hypothetical protein [Fimbriimonadaceae bacterium]HRJ95881.1 hypothetical protein [Fimbriimonadaceae bacterium]